MPAKKSSKRKPSHRSKATTKASAKRVAKRGAKRASTTRPAKRATRKLARSAAPPRRKAASKAAGRRKTTSARPGAARARAARDTAQFIGLMVLDFTNPFFAEVARGVETAATGAGYHVLLCNSGDDEIREVELLRLLQERALAGLVITPAETNVLDYLNELRESGMPVVLLDHPAEDYDLSSVAVDNLRGGEMVGEYLASLGHERFAFVTGPLSIPQCADRRDGLFDALERRGLNPSKSVDVHVMAGMNIREGQLAADRIVSSNKPPSGIFCANDLMALGTLQTLTERGYDVPQDFSVVGYDDIPLMSNLEKPLTTMRQPKYELGHTAARFLIEEIEGRRKVPQHQMFTPQLVVRSSSGRSTSR